MSKATKTARIPENQPLTEEESKIIASIREKYASQINDDSISENTIIRFVRGYKDDPKPAEKADTMFGSMLQWRKDNKVAEIAAKQPHPRATEFNAIWQQGLHGVSREGHPVYIDRIGQVDGSALMKHFDMAAITELHISMMELITAAKDRQSATTGRRIYKQLVILDLKGLGVSHMGSKFTDPMKQFIAIDQERYPETLFVMIIVNASWVVKSLWALLSPFIDPITKQNIKWGKESIAEYMDDSQVPRFLGGKCACPAAKCLQVPFVSGATASTASDSLQVGDDSHQREHSSKETAFRPTD